MNVVFKYALIIIGISLSTVSIADVKLARLFSDNMVFQQQTNAAVWGWAEPGEAICIDASWGAKAKATTDKDGRWKLFLKTVKHGGPYTVSIKGKNTITLKNVLLGEVWLCAGQSNMGWAMGNSFGAEAESKNANMPNFRIFKSQREHWHKPLEYQRDRLSKWVPCTPESAAKTSAVSYYFGKKLHKELGIPIGIVVQAYAGTPIEGWMPVDIQKDDPRLKIHMDKYKTSAERQIRSGATEEKAIATFNNELATYNKSIDAGKIMKNKFKKLSPPIITKPASIGHQYPANIFNAMIYPIRPFAIRGMIWYQGERNAKNVPQALHYRVQLARMIKYYRSSWHKMSNGNVADDFPVYFTQLPSWNPAQTKPVEGIEASWAVSREAMRLVTQDLSNTGMVVSIDTGNEIDLHPKNKQAIGIRHAYLALKNVYGKKLVPHGPFYKSHKISGNKIIISFDSTGSGLVSAKDTKINSFAIAGADKKWHWAEVKLVGDTIVLTSPAVPKPAAARYAWAMNPSQRNLIYNKEGLPASPFRTDDWPLYDPKAELQEVNKPAKPKNHVSKDWKRPKMTQ
jgi:sialate O-acetylesterase